MTFSNEDKDTFSEIVASVFAPLIAAGFVHKSTQLKSSAALGDFLEIFLVSDSRRRRLRIALLRAGVKEAVSVHVEKTDNGTFVINDFLKQQGVSDSLLNQCELSSYPGSLSARLGGCLAFINTMLEKNLASVLDGHSWPDVPIDWGNYR